MNRQSFFPPSFPSQLETSTPPLNAKRHKPQPIAPCSPPPSSPRSLQSFDASRPQRPPPPQASSSQLAISPTRKPTKRAHTPNHTTEDAHMDISTPHSLSARSPLAKKARTDAHPRHTDPDVSIIPAPVPPSTPPPTSSPPIAPVTPVSKGKGLGNARGLPVPATPDQQHPLPTLTELLATSRRSRPRPRPPSRKNTPHTRAHGAASSHGSESELPGGAARATPEPSPTKTYFSSPASGSSDEEEGEAGCGRSPVSPLFGFTQDPGAFAPRFVSTQKAGDGAGAGQSDPFAPSQSLGRASSGFLGMGYSSQFYVEGHVEQVSELLERDVDFNGWLRDLGSDDGACA